MALFQSRLGVKAGLDEWKEAAQITDGVLFRSINKLAEFGEME
jgi:hypothetical protein